MDILNYISSEVTLDRWSSVKSQIPPLIHSLYPLVHREGGAWCGWADGWGFDTYVQLSLGRVHPELVARQYRQSVNYSMCSEDPCWSDLIFKS